MKKSLKKEQVDLLKFEKQLLALGAGLGALTGSAAVGAQAAVGDVAAEQTAKMHEAYLHLVETVQAAHHEIEVRAMEAGYSLFQAGGAPKDRDIGEVARSLLGIG